MGVLTPDTEVISVHPMDLKAVWIDGKCKVCQSVTIEAFADALDSDKVVSGWNPIDGKPGYCEIEGGGKFYFIHLCDASNKWLDQYRASIALATGLVVYWRNEALIYRSFVKDRVLHRNKVLHGNTVRSMCNFMETLYD
jgi:hypothetical protein